VSNQVINLVS